MCNFAGLADCETTYSCCYRFQPICAFWEASMVLINSLMYKFRRKLYFNFYYNFTCTLTKTSSQYVWIFVIYYLIIYHFISIFGYCVTDLILWVFPVLMVLLRLVTCNRLVNLGISKQQHLNLKTKNLI